MIEQAMDAAAGSRPMDTDPEVQPPEAVDGQPNLDEAQGQIDGPGGMDEEEAKVEEAAAVPEAPIEQT